MHYPPIIYSSLHLVKIQILKNSQYLKSSWKSFEYSLFFKPLSLELYQHNYNALYRSHCASTRHFHFMIGSCSLFHPPHFFRRRALAAAPPAAHMELILQSISALYWWSFIRESIKFVFYSSFFCLRFFFHPIKKEM